MKSEKGDLITLALAGRFDVIVHGCNCFCSMGGGIAKTIQEIFPTAYAADLGTPKGDRHKLGSFSSAVINRNGYMITIINGYSQYHFDGADVLVDYQAIRRLFAKIKAEFSGKRIGYPKIGAGLAGGDWRILAAIIDEEMEGLDHTVVLYSPSSH